MSEREWQTGEIRDLGEWLYGKSTPGTAIIRSGEKWAILYNTKPVVDVGTKEPLEFLTRDGAIAHALRVLRAAGRLG